MTKSTKPQSLAEARALRLIAQREYDRAKLIGNTQRLSKASADLTSATHDVMRLEHQRELDRRYEKLNEALNKCIIAYQ